MYEIFDDLERVGWDDEDWLRSWPSLIWYQGTICLGLPHYWWHEENDMDFKSWPSVRVWVGLRVQNVFDLPHLWMKGLNKLRGLQRFLWFEDLDWHTNCVWSALVIGRHGEVKKWWGTSNVAPSVTMMVRVKLPYLGINDMSYEWWNEATV